MCSSGDILCAVLCVVHFDGQTCRTVGGGGCTHYQFFVFFRSVLTLGI